MLTLSVAWDAYTVTSQKELRDVLKDETDKRSSRLKRLLKRKHMDDDIYEKYVFRNQQWIRSIQVIIWILMVGFGNWKI